MRAGEQVVHSGAIKAVSSALKKTLKEPADDLRRLEVERLDALLQGLWRQARDGNQGAVDRCIRIMERRAKLLGLDAPTKIEQDNTGITKVVVEYVDTENTTPPPASGTTADQGGA